MVPINDNDVGLEDMEFRFPEVNEVKESSMESSKPNSSEDSRSPEVMMSPVDIVMNEEDWRNGSDIHGDRQDSSMGMDVHGKSQQEVESSNNNENNNDVAYTELPSYNVEKNNV
ncbi:unnamed protein product [Lactuca saligna]|uniref:Uncharacterized protein n=1 Tax=Lactuca saligna TaxID=75948 RepID=A0AA35VXM5_LACSI|nr:unnamed protein product [Lactuca saligna]